MKYTISEVSSGRCAIKNDGTLEELRRVIKLAFPGDENIPIGAAAYYKRGDHSSERWIGCGRVAMPSQSVKDFLWEPKWGERVEWLYDNGMVGDQATFVGLNPYPSASTSISRYILKSDAGRLFYVNKLRLPTPSIPKEVELTMKEIADKFQISVGQLRIKKD